MKCTPLYINIKLHNLFSYILASIDGAVICIHLKLLNYNNTVQNQNKFHLGFLYMFILLSYAISTNFFNTMFIYWE